MLSASFCVGARKRYFGFGDRSNGRSFKPKKVSYMFRAPISPGERFYGEGAPLRPHRPSALPACRSTASCDSSSVAAAARKSPSCRERRDLGQTLGIQGFIRAITISTNPPGGIQLGYLREQVGPVGKRHAVHERIAHRCEPFWPRAMRLIARAPRMPKYDN